MRDADIRRSLRAEVQERHRRDPETRIIDELGLCQGEVRVDVAVVNGALKGYEIKSLADTLRRLPVQVHVYSKVLDYATIVLAEAHRADACELIPDWWEVIIAIEDGDGIRLEESRKGTMNPGIETRALAELLWHADALELLRGKGCHRGLSGKPRAYVWDRVAQVCSVDEVRDAVRAKLKERSARRSGQ